METIICKKCKKMVDTENEIGVTLDIYALRIEKGFIKSKLASEVEKNYLPITFQKSLCGEVHLCSKCLDEFLAPHNY